MFRPEYTITNELVNNVAEIEASNQLILNIDLVTDWEAKLRDEATIQSLKSQASIDDVSINSELIKRLLHNINSQRGKIRDFIEIVNYKKALDFVVLNTSQTLSLSLIQNVHKVLLKDVIANNLLGEVRVDGAVIFDQRKNEVAFEPVSSDSILDELDNLFQWYNNSKVNEILKSGILQYEIMRIHPFVDGNGRLARIMCMWSLYKFGYDAKGFYNLEEYYDENLDKYYEKLGSAEGGDLTEWLEYFAEGFASEISKIKSKVLKIFHGGLVLEKGLRYTDRQKKIIAFIKKKGEIKFLDYNQLFPELSDDTVLREIQKLCKLGVLVKEGKTKGVRYLLGG